MEVIDLTRYCTKLTKNVVVNSRIITVGTFEVSRDLYNIIRVYSNDTPLYIKNCYYQLHSFITVDMKFNSDGNPHCLLLELELRKHTIQLRKEKIDNLLGGN